MKKIFFFVLLFTCIQVSAQRVIDVNNVEDKTILQNFYISGGEPFSNLQYVRLIDGSPYYNDKWMKGTVYFEDGTGYTGLYLKLDLLKGNIHYQGFDKAEYVVQADIKKVVLTDTVNSTSAEFINSQYWNTPGVYKGWYQVIKEGNAGLYKLHRKILRENKKYGVSTTEQEIETKPQYIVLMDKKAFQVKKFKDLPEILHDKKNEISEFIKVQDLDGKKESDYVQVIEYYNGL